MQAGGEAFIGSGTWTNNFFIAGAGPQNENGNGAIRASGTLSGTVTLIGDAGVSGNSTYSGKITGGFGLQLGPTANIGGSSNTITLSNPNANNTANGNDWTGTTTIVGRTGASVLSTTVRLGASQQIPNGATAGNVVFGANGQTASLSTFDLGGFNETINGLSVGSGATASLMTVTSTVAGSTLTMGDNNTTASYAGVITGAANLGVTKIGTGTQTLTGANTYTGATTVSAGTLEVGSGGSLAAGTTSTVNGGTLLANGTVNGPVIVNSGGTLRGAGTVAGAVTANSGGAVGGGSTLTLSNASVTMNNGSSFNLVLNATPTQPSVNSTAANALQLNSTVTVNIAGSAIVNTTYTLIDYVGGLGGGGFGALSLGTQPNRTVGNLVDNTTNTSVDYFVTAVDSARWSGALSSEWSTATLAAPKNWVLHSDGTTQTDYIEGDVVHFTDSAATTTPDVSVADVAPAAVDFSNSTATYIVSGTRSINVQGNLSKSLGGTTTLNTNNTMGTMTVNAGSLRLGGSNTVSGVATVNGGTLQVGTGGTAGSLSASGMVLNGTLAFNRTDSVTFSTPITSGSGGVQQNGSGTTTFSVGNGYSGGLTVNNGTARLTNVTAAGTGTATVNAGGSLVVGAAITNSVTLAGGTLGVASGADYTMPAAATLNVSAASSVVTADPQTPTTTRNIQIDGTLNGGGNITVTNATNVTNVDGGQGFRAGPTGKLHWHDHDVEQHQVRTLGAHANGELLAHQYRQRDFDGWAVRRRQYDDE